MIYKEVEFFREAKKRGRIEEIKRYDDKRYTRFAMTLDNVTRFVDIADEVYIDLNLDAS